MGNYYEGIISFRLKKDTPRNIVDMLNFLDANLVVGCDRPTFEAVINEFNINHEGAEKYDTFPNVNKCGDYVRLSICTKHFKTNSILWMIDMCRPYMVNDGPEDNYLGNISDEDGYYDKSFYINDEMFKNEMKKRYFICNPSCDKFNKDVACNFYDICIRAYNIGKADNEKL